jgi:hypothetical protein
VVDSYTGAFDIIESRCAPQHRFSTEGKNMSSQSRNDKLRIGFLTSIETDSGGFVGGLLVTNRLGRPLEFQCTTPVKPNHTQRILYGPTLVPFLLGELIGKTLIERVSVKPHVLLVDRGEMLDVREHVPMPVASLDQAEASIVQPGLTVKLGKQQLRIHADHPDDQQTIASHQDEFPSDVDFREPFERVREALLETVRPGAVA